MTSTSTCAIRRLVCCALLGIACVSTIAKIASIPAVLAEDDLSGELPRIAPTEPAAALGTIRVLPGFRIEQVAAEPLVHSPVAISFDAAGRMYVVEMIDYSEQATEHLGTVRLLEDCDGDGRFDKSTVFADGLSWPTAVICYDGGVFVGAAPDIYYLKDTDGDGKADLRKTVFTGFGRSNIQGLLNSFQWGLDNRIHGATSSSGGQVRRADRPDETPINLSGRDFAFNPKTLELAATSGGAQHGMCFDDWGRKFVSSNSDHIQMVMFEDRYLARNRYLAAPSARLSIAADGPQAEVFRISPVEPWRIVRTRLRVSGAVPGAIEGGGRAAGYFTGATGVTLYRGDAWPAEYVGQAFVGDVGSNLVDRKILEPQGVAMLARRADPGREFVASTDIWFRPAQFANAPDGNLYIIDVYREVIEHPESLPPVIKKHLDLTSGRDRGRIYRVVREDFRQPVLARLDCATTTDLVAQLDSPNGWRRDTAARLLYERQDRAALTPLHQLAQSAAIPQGRLHALYALAGMQQLTVDDLLPRLGDAHPRVREHAVRLAEKFAGDSAALRDRLLALVSDPDPRVRYQLAFTLGEFHDPRNNDALVRLLKQDGRDTWIRLAVFSSLSERPGRIFASLLDDVAFRSDASGGDVLAAVVRQVGLQAAADDVSQAVAAIEKLPDGQQQLAAHLAESLMAGLQRRKSRLRETIASQPGKFRMLLDRMLSEARQSAGDESQSAGRRTAAIHTLELAPAATVRDFLSSLLAAQQPPAVRSAALKALASFDDPEVGGAIIAAWPALGPTLRAAATEAVLSRRAWTLALLGALETEAIPLSDIDPNRLRMLAHNRDPEVRRRGALVADRLKLARRHDVVEAYQPALSMRGDPARGKQHFQKQCAVCHKLEGTGYEIGPNLAALQNRGAEAILVNVLDPNREVNPQYVNYTVVTTDGRTLSGLIAAETANSITLKRQEGATDTVLRNDIEELHSSGLSIMPEGLEKQLDAQAVADLIAYILSVK